MVSKGSVDTVNMRSTHLKQRSIIVQLAFLKISFAHYVINNVIMRNKQMAIPHKYRITRFGRTNMFSKLKTSIFGHQKIMLKSDLLKSDIFSGMIVAVKSGTF